MDAARLRRLERAFAARRQLLERQLAHLNHEAAAAAAAKREMEASMEGPLFPVLGLWQASLQRLAMMDERLRKSEAARSVLIGELAESAGLTRRIDALRRDLDAASERKQLETAVLESLARGQRQGCGKERLLASGEMKG